MRSMVRAGAATVVVAPAVDRAAVVPAGDVADPAAVAGTGVAPVGVARVEVAGTVAVGAAAGIAGPAGACLTRITDIPVMAITGIPDITAIPMVVGDGGAGKPRFRLMTAHGAASGAAPWQV